MRVNFMRVEEVATELGVSKSYVYKLVQKLNEELHEKGYLTVAGRVSRPYFEEKLYYSNENRKEVNVGTQGRKRHMASDLSLCGLDWEE